MIFAFHYFYEERESDIFVFAACRHWKRFSPFLRHYYIRACALKRKRYAFMKDIALLMLRRADMLSAFHFSWYIDKDISRYAFEVLIYIWWWYYIFILYAIWYDYFLRRHIFTMRTRYSRGRFIFLCHIYGARYTYCRRHAEISRLSRADILRCAARATAPPARRFHASLFHDKEAR